ncbi:tripartite tricarboxylate transporter substrate binding protein [Ramlibacter tataouinensis]|uniref:Candidate extracytoplasmic binding receptor n=1 Tax=Ramlibacter tataouinensis (strain ATCC BAA-407 / DSM 14655 / LMG 21543 / TTB310) TaxID=365046 RepID=F5XZ04_RAMTT|nr:tripartite tricarboxylate transporter substrate binding protein [Ramlibacter tataouinensis]AEG91992.1 Candidate extracytoplasmic binding receptor [Ramlibacter tataouinensis TTB310]
MTAPAASRRTLLRLAGATLAAPWLAHAQDTVAGGGTVTLVVSYPAGGGADLMARLIAPHLSRALGQNVVVDNKPGASGQIAASQVARATPDGSQLLLDASSFAVNPSLFPKLPYDSDKAFTPLAVLALFPNVLVSHPGHESKNVRDLIKAAKARPGQIAYASSGNGSAQHLAGALFEDRAGVSLTHVPYKGGGPAMNDVIGGQVPLFFANVASSLGHIQAGKLRPLAVTSRRRARVLPEVPTMEEAGVPGYEVLEWNPVLAPAGISPAVKTRLGTALRRAMSDPEVLGRVRSLSGEVFPDGPEGLVPAFIKAQQAQWARVVRDRKIAVG